MEYRRRRQQKRPRSSTSSAKQSTPRYMGPTTARRPTLRKKLVTAPSSWPPAWHQRDQDDVTSSKLCHWSSVKIQERKSQVTIKEGNLRGKSVRCRRSVSHATADRGEPQQCRVPRGVSSLAGGILWGFSAGFCGDLAETRRIFCAVPKNSKSGNSSSHQ